MFLSLFGNWAMNFTFWRIFSLKLLTTACHVSRSNYWEFFFFSGHWAKVNEPFGFFLKVYQNFVQQALKKILMKNFIENSCILFNIYGPWAKNSACLRQSLKRVVNTAFYISTRNFFGDFFAKKSNVLASFLEIEWTHLSFWWEIRPGWRKLNICVQRIFLGMLVFFGKNGFFEFSWVFSKEFSDFWRKVFGRFLKSSFFVYLKHFEQK